MEIFQSHPSSLLFLFLDPHFPLKTEIEHTLEDRPADSDQVPLAGIIAAIETTPITKKITAILKTNKGVPVWFR